MAAIGGVRSFNMTEAGTMFKDVPDDLLAGILSAETTIVYGAPGVGKGRVMAEIIVSGLNGESFAGCMWSQKLTSVEIITTDSGGAREYDKYLRRAGLRPTQEPAVTFHSVEDPGRVDWRELAASIAYRSPSPVIVDNSTEAVRGSVNDSENVQRFTDALAPLYARMPAIPLVLVHHVAKPSAETGGRRGQTPIGSGLWEAFSRNKVLVRDGFRAEAADVTLELRPRFSPAWELRLNNADNGRLTVAAVITSADKASAKRKRSDATKVRNVEVAKWVVANGDGTNVSATSKLVAKEFGLNPNSTRAALQQARDYGALLQRTDGRWQLMA
ncbi:MAG: AAA family ATPase [Actinomycetota bacterium]|nr:AAA family ATPase [Actinomycetota bacterium]